MWMTTGLFHEIAAIDPGVFAGKRTVLVGGDTTNLELVRAVYRAGADAGLQLLHGYGPTENTTFSTRSEEHTSELQSLMRISYAVFCLNKKKTIRKTQLKDTHRIRA